MTRIRILLLIAAAIVNFSIVLMAYSAVYDGGNRGNFFLDFKESADLYAAVFLTPLILAISCVIAIFLRDKKVLGRYRPECIPFLVLILTLASNYILADGLGLVALSSPFVLLAWILSLSGIRALRE